MTPEELGKIHRKGELDCISSHYPHMFSKCAAWDEMPQEVRTITAAGAAAVAARTKALDEFQTEIGAWGDETFPTSTSSTVLAHLTEEVLELNGLSKDDIERIMEAIQRLGGGAVDEDIETADVFILTIQFAHKMRFSLYDAAEHKMAINRQRTWKTTPEPEGHVKHEETPA